MKVLLVLNKPNREIPIMESIKREILSLQKNAIIEITEMCRPGFNQYVFKFKPDVILTFPFTCEGFSHWYYLFKVFLGVKIICFRAEGVIDFSNEYNVEWAVGFDDYGKTLVDCELFWGEKIAVKVGQKLLQQQKLSSTERVEIVGYPRLESYFKENEYQLPVLPSRINRMICKYEKERIVLFITGFHLANYTKQNLFDAKDLNAENMLDELLDAVEITKRYRAEWISNIITAANETPSSLMVVKKHPIEKKEDYVAFKNVENILFIYEEIQVEEIIPYAGVFFHYGSTALVDAYLTEIPAIYVYSVENKEWYSDLGWPSNQKIEVNDISDAVSNLLAERLVYEKTGEIKRVLQEIFNIEEGKPYRPSREIAKIILDNSPPQKIKVTDPYFLKALLNIIYARTFGRFVNLLNKIKQ